MSFQPSEYSGAYGSWASELDDMIEEAQSGAVDLASRLEQAYNVVVSNDEVVVEPAEPEPTASEPDEEEPETGWKSWALPVGVGVAISAVLAAVYVSTRG